jgi:hypothetical protein
VEVEVVKVHSIIHHQIMEDLVDQVVVVQNLQVEADLEVQEQEVREMLVVLVVLIHQTLAVVVELVKLEGALQDRVKVDMV